MYYIYILKSESDPDRTYTGITNDLIRRLREHNEGEVTSTRPFMPWSIEASFMVDREATAVIVERYFKNSVGKEKFIRFAEANPDHLSPKQGFFDSLTEGRGFGSGEKRFIVKQEGGLRFFALT